MCRGQSCACLWAAPPYRYPSLHSTLPAARERIIGWYHTGPRLREADIDISELIGRYCDNPLLVICEVQVRSIEQVSAQH